METLAVDFECFTSRFLNDSEASEALKIMLGFSLLSGSFGAPDSWRGNHCA